MMPKLGEAERSFARKRLPGLILGLSLLALSTLLSHPGRLEEPFTTKQFFGLCSALAFFLLSLSGWGSLLARSARLRTFFPKILLGSLSLASFSGIVGNLGLFGPPYRLLFLGVLLIGSAWSFPGGVGLHLKAGFRKLPLAYWLVLLFTFSVFVLLFRTGTFFQTLRPQSDAFAYDVFAPWWWWESGRISFTPSSLHLLLASYWNFLYVWVFPLLGTEGNSRIGAIVFCQLLHLLLGFGGSVLGVYSILRKLKVPRDWCITSALYGATIFPILWTAWTAKNDFGSIFWLIGSLYFLSINRTCFSGIFAGAAVAAKNPAAIPLAFLCPYLLGTLNNGSRLSNMVRFTGSALLCLLPHLARNWFATGNPFFPVFLNLIPSPSVARTAQTMIYGQLGEGQTGGITNFLPSLMRLMAREPFLAASAFFAILCTFRGQNRRLKFLFLCSLFSLFSGVLWLGRSLEDDAYIRYLAPSLLLVQAFSLALLGDLRSLPLKSRERNLLLLALLLLAPVFRPHIPWRIPFFTSAPDYLSAYREQADGGACKAWLASQIGKEDSVLSLQDFGLYLVGTRNIRIGILDRELDDLIRAQSSPELLFGEFRKKGFRWVYQLDPQDAEPYLPHAARITAWMRQQKQELVFDRRDCLVLDLKAQGS